MRIDLDKLAEDSSWANFIRIVKMIGPGFNVDTPIEEYRDERGRPRFDVFQALGIEGVIARVYERGDHDPVAVVAIIWRIR